VFLLIIKNTKMRPSVLKEKDQLYDWYYCLYLDYSRKYCSSQSDVSGCCYPGRFPFI